MLDLATLACAVQTLAFAAPEAERPYWVLFADRGDEAANVEAALARAEQDLAPRALERRTRVRGDRGVDVRDLPPSAAYVRAIAGIGARVRATSRWLNAVSVAASPEQRAAIAALPFVAGLQPVARARREPGRYAAPKRGERPRELAAYGVAQTQLELLKVPELHACGLTGAGVVIGVQDSGFRLTHQALAGIEVLAARDFIQGDDTVEDEAGDAEGQHNHGTSVLSLIAGHDGETFSGAAPGVKVLLAKTEQIDVEEPFEEDLYVAGLEWIEGMGADLFTASLGYIDWYEFSDLDGKTAVVSQAAAVAIENGLIMLTAVGNAGPEPSTLIAPADVDGIIAVGATNLDGVLADFSSRGPTADGRIKPDLLAPGKDVWVVRPNTLAEYGQGNGTSYATPLAAGVAALLLEAYPQLDPAGMLALLRATASQPDMPDNESGWGMIDAFAAAGLYCTCVDADADGHFDKACGGDDCADGDPTTYPGAREICDGVDNDCDAITPADEIDGDGDGVRLCAGDCDDGDATRWPGAPELPDDCIDNDCDGVGDPACAPTTGEPGASGSGGSGETDAATTTGTTTTGESSGGEPPGSSASEGGGATGAQGCGCAAPGGGLQGGMWALVVAAWARRRRR